jgi:hypothetical protein
MSKHLSVDRHEPLDVDSTQTMRAITLPELNDAGQPKWFVVQLAVSDRPINLETMPRLDVFAAHRLYVVVGKQNNTTRYALRLGFFPDEVSADMVCSHLRTFFRTPSIVRVSTAEHARFAQRVAARAAAQKPASSVSQPANRDASMTERSNAAPAPKAPIRPASSSSSASGVQSATLAPKLATSSKTTLPITTGGTAQRLLKKTKTLGEELLEEARQVQVSRRGKNRGPVKNESWLSRLFGGAKS